MSYAYRFVFRLHLSSLSIRQTYIVVNQFLLREMLLDRANRIQAFVEMIVTGAHHENKMSGGLFI